MPFETAIDKIRNQEHGDGVEGNIKRLIIYQVVTEQGKNQSCIVRRVSHLAEIVTS